MLFTNGTKKFVEYLNAKYGIDKEHIKSIVDKGDIPNAYREGKIGREAFWKKVQEELAIPEDINILEKRS